ncbi:MAG: hypothetical protein ACQGQO_11525, partial [Sphaerochaetaceae bacterium]
FSKLLKNPLKRSLEDLRKSKYSLTRWESINESIPQYPVIRPSFDCCHLLISRRRTSSLVMDCVTCNDGCPVIDAPAKASIYFPIILETK